MATAAHLRIVPHGDLDAPERGDRAHGLVVDDAFVQAHAGYVRRLVCRMGVPVSDVDDAVQEVFLAALRRAATFEVGRSPRAWLFGIARHCARKIYRGAREVSAGEPPEPSVGPEQETALERKRARSMVHQALDALPEAQRDVVILHKLEGWSMPSVADAVGCTVATAHSRYRLGRIHIERIIRGRVVRARMAAAVAMVMAFLGWNAPTAAAAAVTACLVGGGFLLSQAAALPPSSQATPVDGVGAPSTRASGMRATARPSEEAGTRTLQLPEPSAVTVAGPAGAGDDFRGTRERAAWEGEAHRAGEADEAVGDSAPAVDEAVSSVPGGPLEPLAPQLAALAEAPATATPEPPTAPPLDAPLESAANLEAWAEEGRLLRHARQLTPTDPAAARAALREYRQRFPSGRLAREAARLGVTLGM